MYANAFQDIIPNISSALIGDGRFHPRLSSKDIFNESTKIYVDVDLFKLKSESEMSAKKTADRVKRNNSDQSVGQQVLAMLQSSKYRRGKASNLDGKRDDIQFHIEQNFQRNECLDLLISFFPCKIRQSLKTFAKTGGEIDLGEIASLLRFYEIARAIEHLSGCTAKFVILCDGYRYQSCFEDSNKAIQQYKSNLMAAIKYLKLKKYITLVEEMEHLPASVHSEIDMLHFDILRQFLGGKNEYLHIISSLIPNIVLNFDIDPMLISRNDMKKFYCAIFEGDIHQDLLKQKFDNRLLEVLEKSTSRACRFVAINEIIRKHHQEKKLFPNSIRCTVHPKEGQIGIHTINKETTIFPHCGQGIIRSKDPKKFGLKDIRVEFSANILRGNTNPVSGVLSPSSQLPFIGPEQPFYFAC